MKKKMLAGVLAAVVGLTGIPVPTAAQQTSQKKHTNAVSMISPMEAIRAQNAIMNQQEKLEEEENVPAEEPDPLVIDDNGSVVPASTAAWTKENSDSEEDVTSGEAEDVFSDGSTEVSAASTVLSDDNGEEDSGVDSIGDQEEELTDDVSEITETPDQGSETEAEQENVEEIQQEPDGESADSKQGKETVNNQFIQEDFTAGETEDFSDGSASEGKQGVYRTVTLQIKDGEDITAPLNTLLWKLKDKATDENPYKIIIPPGNYNLTGTLCMYSNMYLYAQGATITKTSVNKHILLRLGNTLESEGGYNGYRNIVIDGGTWDFNYKIVKEKDAPGGFVGFSIGHATNVTVKNATFLNNLKSHFLEFGGIKNARITGCTFRGYYKNYVKGGQECIQIDCCTDENNVFPQYQPYDGTTCEDFVIEDNVFEDVFAGLGTHSMMAGKTYKRITVRDNTFHNVKKRCIEFLNYEDSVAEDNTMVNVGTGVEVSAVNLKNTHKTKGYNGGPGTSANRNIRVTGNYISLSKTSSIGGYAWICSGINVLGYNMKRNGGVIPKGIYSIKGITVEDNRVTGYGNGIRMTLSDSGTLNNNRIKVKNTSAFSNLGISAEDSRGTAIRKNTVSGTANAGVYVYDGVYVKKSQKKNIISGNVVSAAGGDGIYLGSMAAPSTVEKNTVKSTGGSGIRVNAGKNVNIFSNSSSKNKNHGIKIEYTTGGIRAKSNRVFSNKKSGILIWKSRVTEISGNKADKNKGNGIYAYASVIPVMKSNSFSGNGKIQAVYAKSCKGWTSINRPACKKITAASTAINGTASGSRSVTAYVQKSGKFVKLGVSSVNKKKQYVIKIKKQKKNTALKLVSKDKYGNTVTVNTVVK